MSEARSYKILYLNEARVFGGAEKSLLLLLKNLDRNRFTPLVACPSESNFAKELNELGVKVFPVRYPGLKNIAAVFAISQEIRRIVQQESIDLIHANTPRTNVLGAIAARLCKIPIVWHERTLLEKPVAKNTITDK